MIIYSTAKPNESEKSAISDIMIRNKPDFFNDRNLPYLDEVDFFVIAKFEEQIIGFAMMYDNDKNLQKSFGKTNLSWHLEIDNTFHQHGVGTELLNYIKERSKDYELLCADINPRNQASLALHKKAGLTNAHDTRHVLDTTTIPNKKSFLERDIKIVPKRELKEK